MKGVIMARKAAAPSYLHHKASGQAYTRINGKMVYLGAFNSRESREKWAEIVSDWSAGNLDKYGESVSVSRLCAAYVKHSERYYRKNGATCSVTLPLHSLGQVSSVWTKQIPWSTLEILPP